VSFEEYHEESETHKNHNMDVHEHSVEAIAFICGSVVLSCDQKSIISMGSHTFIKFTAGDEKDDHSDLGNQEARFPKLTFLVLCV